MDARELLRQYLEQRRELGERDLVLDTLNVEDALRAIGAGPRASHGPRASTPAEPPVNPVPRIQRVSEDAPTDWREALRAAGAAPGAKSATPPVAPQPGTSSPKPPQPVAASAAAPVEDREDGIVVGSASSELFGGPLSRIDSLDGLAKQIAACTACALHVNARNPVPGEGNPEADFVCVGEAPGEAEDASGRPFVGRAGELLTQILAAIKLSRDEVFICNVLKHRPPGNRNPAPDEIVACKAYLLRQLEIVRPRVILALGTFAAQTLLETKLAIGKLRGQIHRFHGVPLVVTYHPAALLRNPAWKRPTWEDVQFARRLLDRARSGA